MKPKNARNLSLQAPQLFIALAGLVIGLSNTASAVALAKNNTTTWNATTDWTPAQVPTSADALTIGNSPMTAATMAAMSLGGNVSCLSLDFRAASDVAANRSLRITPGNTLTLGAGPTMINQSNNKALASVLDCAVELTANSIFNIQGSIVFNNSISQSGGDRSLSLNTNFGALHLNAANSYVGTNVNRGILTLGSSGTLGATTGSLTVGNSDNNPGILDLGGTTQTVATANFNRAYVLNGTIIASTYGSLIGLVSANLQGASAALSANDNRGLTLSGTNSYTGATTLNGILRATKPTALPNSGASGTITIGAGTGYLIVRAGAASGEWGSTDIGGLLANGTFTVT